MKNIFPFLLFFLCVRLNAQYTVQNAHSHNDYANRVPFWTAYNAHFESIEADIFAVDGALIVAHSKSEAKKGRTLDDLYIQPLVLRYEQNRNKPWPDYDGKLQLLIDLKTPAASTLGLLVDRLKQYPDVFDRSVNPHAVQIVITGNMPKPADFGMYPSFIMFDGRPSTTYSPEQLERIALYSAAWNMPKSKSLTAADRTKVEETIRTVHELNKKIRFWATDDTPEAWKMLMDLGVDYINTDKINELAEYLK
ncbi:MAG: phosphatidylinositol-specific phospholipase C/glycerophosphodiester phosphodiesterase family protein [Bacteroidales bacterium]|jgi:alkaline phosphatase|nr:phosphatidylinositol-specific phospholipase C/glycerophosphodiester phosphodiesterase family protein [Bacteroidales bacterium]